MMATTTPIVTVKAFNVGDYFLVNVLSTAGILKELERGDNSLSYFVKRIGWPAM